MRSTLIENAKAHLSQVIGDITSGKILEIYTDISTACGERVFVFMLDRNLEKDLPRKRNSVLSRLDITRVFL
jgi:uncharacterized protein YbcI